MYTSSPHWEKCSGAPYVSNNKLFIKKIMKSYIHPIVSQNGEKRQYLPEGISKVIPKDSRSAWPSCCCSCWAAVESDRCDVAGWACAVLAPTTARSSCLTNSEVGLLPATPVDAKNSPSVDSKRFLFRKWLWNCILSERMVLTNWLYKMERFQTK